MNKLLIISSDYISSWISKGEVVDRYYNPGNIFEEVHILLTNNDRPDIHRLQPMVGDAKLYVHNYPEPKRFFSKTVGWHPYLMKFWVKKIVEFCSTINASVVRCYGLHLNAYVATELKRKTNIPFILSLHGNPDIDYFRGRLAITIREKILGLCYKRLEKYCLKAVDHVIAVYSPIEPYLKEHRVEKYSIVHNVVALNAPVKDEYSIDKRNVKLLCVGRQTHLQKDPSSIVRAVAKCDNYKLTMVGDGDLHDNLVKLAKDLGCESRVDFIKSKNNAELLNLMLKSDIYIYHSINYEISKSCIEAALVGLPIVLNNRFNHPATELVEARFVLVDDTAEGYADALELLVNNLQLRQNIARFSHEYAKSNWAPEVTEKKIVDIYKRFL